ncbi:hypothetical protein ACQBAT_06060 [Ornithinimicrobium sp. Y1847]|uniref:hypothetical protein n=1 Tax=Ornithinimicrobium sp. Y1847 TaxID=3405419 RepID=UPI003B67C185
MSRDTGVGLRWWPVLLLLLVLVVAVTYGHRYLIGFSTPIPCELDHQSCLAQERRRVQIASRYAVGLPILAALTLVSVLVVAVRRPGRAHASPGGGSGVLAHVLLAGLLNALVWAAAAPLVLFSGFLAPAWAWLLGTLAGLLAVVGVDRVHASRRPSWSPRRRLLLAWIGVVPPLLVLGSTLFLPADIGQPGAIYTLVVLGVLTPIVVLVARLREP